MNQLEDGKKVKENNDGNICEKHFEEGKGKSCLGEEGGGDEQTHDNDDKEISVEQMNMMEGHARTSAEKKVMQTQHPVGEDHLSILFM